MSTATRPEVTAPGTYGRLVVATTVASGLLLLASAANIGDRLAPEPLQGFLREGVAALLLGAAYAWSSPQLPWPRRLLFVPWAALMSKLAATSALSLSYALDAVDGPFVAGLAIASTLWASAYAWVACLWLGWKASTADVVPSSAVGGLAAWGMFIALQRTVQGVPVAALLAVYWASWWMLVTLAIVWSRQRHAAA